MGNTVCCEKLLVVTIGLPINPPSAGPDHNDRFAKPSDALSALDGASLPGDFCSPQSVEASRRRRPCRQLNGALLFSHLPRS